MTGLFRSQYANVGALAAAAVVTLGVVTVPPERLASISARTEIAEVQLRAVVSTQAAALANMTATSIPPSASAASAVNPASPQASAIGSNDTLTAIATAAIALVATPFWYLAFPITLPLSVIGGIALGPLIAAVGGAFGANLATFGLIGGLLGLGAFVVGPLGLAFGAISSLLAAPADPLLPAAAQRSANPASSATPNETESPTVTAQTPVADREMPEPARETVASPNRRERGSAQRATATAPPAAVATDVADTTPSAASPITIVSTTAASDASGTPSVPESVSDAIGATGDGTTAESASTEPISRSAGATKTTSQKPSRQRADKAPSPARAGRATG